MTPKKQTSNQAAQPFATRTKEIIGRSVEMELVRRWMETPNARRYLAFFARGGLGKTRLLEEIVLYVRGAGEIYHACPIIDLHHTETHASSDVESMIIEGLDPNARYFETFRAERYKFERLRSRGADPEVLEKQREYLTQVFIKDFNRMSMHARKLVLCFDTLEILQYESSQVEDLIELEKVDPRIRPWLWNTLSQLENVLVVFAGRPKETEEGELTHHQEKLEEAMRAAFGADLDIEPLKPLEPEDIRAFVQDLAPELASDLASPRYLPVVHALTGGRPIYLHLLVDLVHGFGREIARLLSMLDVLAAAHEAGKQSAEAQVKARQDFERQLINELINETGDEGVYLARLALMPKGFDAELLEKALGMPAGEAKDLVARLQKLSFVKQYQPMPGIASPHGERLYFHDEFQRLLVGSGLIPQQRVNERQIAQNLVRLYEEKIQQQLRKIEAEKDTKERSELRKQVYKLQEERLYYLLVQDPQRGYAEYKRLCDEANRWRAMGYGMRLRDEFLRFYNLDKRRKQFASAGIAHEQVIRESMQKWTELLHWMAMYVQEIRFVEKALERKEQLGLREAEDAPILGNVLALWARARTMKYGYEEENIHRAAQVLARLPAIDLCRTQEMLARARLCTTLGYAYRWAGRLEEAVEYSGQAAEAFRKLEDYQDELAIALSNQAYACARLGRIPEARALSREALRINEGLGFEYSAGLSMTNRAFVERMAGQFEKAIEFSQDAREIFQEIEDPHGLVRSYYNLGEAKRKLAKQMLREGRKLFDARQKLVEAMEDLQKGLETAVNGALEAEMPGLRAALGRCCRELAQVELALKNTKESLRLARQGEEYFKQALKDQKGLSQVDRFDVQQDQAELFFSSDLVEEAKQKMLEIEEDLGLEFRIRPPDCAPAPGLPAENFWPLGKVERLRGEIAFKAREYGPGLQHFLLSYAYFQRFSPQALERNQMLETLFDYLSHLAADERTDRMQELRTWVEQNQACLEGLAVQDFLKELAQMFGS